MHVLASTADLSAVHTPIVARDLAKAYGDRVVLDGIGLTVPPGEPLGVVGENGSGKSTLLRLLAGVEQPDAGHVSRPSGLAYLAQDPDLPLAATVADVLESGLKPLRDAALRLEALAAGLADGTVTESEYAAHLDLCTAHDVWDAGRRTAEAAERLGLGHVAPGRRVGDLSGGERSRLALTLLVARRPACVLLDEPTNHLDDGALTYLEEMLAGLPGVVVVATHDRTLLEGSCRSVLDLDPSHFGTDGTGGQVSGGGWIAHLAAKRDARRRWEAAFLAQREEIAALRTAAAATVRQVGHHRPPSDNDKFLRTYKRHNAERSVSRRVRDAERRVEALERNLVPKPPAPLRLALPGGAAPAHRQVATLVDVRVDERLAVGRLDVEAGTPLLVTGPNGSGKSTLLDLLAGRLAATSGVVDVRARRVGLLPQDVVFARLERSAREVYAASGAAVVTPLSELGLLHPRDLDRPVGVLSLGQQRRLALAIVLARRPDLLLLDEPTNHVSLSLADELEEAVRHSPAAIVVTSHDRWLRRRWTGEEVALSAHRL